jgi:hypothetical protein
MRLNLLSWASCRSVVPRRDLGRVVTGVFDAIDDLCWASLSIVDVGGLDHRTVVARGFGEFAVAAGLLTDDE